MHPDSQRWRHIGPHKHIVRSSPGIDLKLNGQKALAALRLLPGTFRVASPPAGSSLVHLPPTRKVTAADENVLLPTQPGLNSSGTGHPKRILLNKVQLSLGKKKKEKSTSSSVVLAVITCSIRSPGMELDALTKTLLVQECPASPNSVL